MGKCGAYVFQSFLGSVLMNTVAIRKYLVANSSFSSAAAEFMLRSGFLYAHETNR